MGEFEFWENFMLLVLCKIIEIENVNKLHARKCDRDLA